MSPSSDLVRKHQASLAVMRDSDTHEDHTDVVAEDGMEMATLGGARATAMLDRIGMGVTVEHSRIPHPERLANQKIADD